MVTKHLDLEKGVCYLDFIGKVCPEPVISTLEALKNMKGDDILEIVVDDPLATKSIPEEVKDFGFSSEVKRIDKGWIIRIMK